MQPVPGATSSALQSLVDLEATVLDAAGLPPSPGSQGICQAASWQDADDGFPGGTDPGDPNRYYVRVVHAVAG